MKLVAATDFRNTNPDKIQIDDTPHELHVPKGARFTIGGDLPIEKLTAADKELIAAMNAGGRIVDEEKQPDKVKQIDEEVKSAAAAAKKREAVVKTAKE